MPAPLLLLLPGDGIGPEVMAQTRRIIDWMGENLAFDVHVEEDLVGGCAFDAHKTPLPEATMEKALRAHGVLLGAVGGPNWDNVPYDKRPEAALLRLRKELELFANLRPALCMPALANASTLKRPLVEGLDIMIVRELTGGIYFGQPRGIEVLKNGQRRGVNTQVYESHEIHRVAEVAFKIAEQRDKRVTSVEKRNVMESGLLWYEEVIALHKKSFPHIKLEHMLADNCAMQLVRRPKQFSVIVTDNLFGDILSDIAAMLTGSLGMLPSASLGATLPDGRVRGLYEPVHGSAPDIANKNLANPTAMILSFAMALRTSFHRKKEADLLEKAVSAVYGEGLRTQDTMQKGCKLASTEQMGDAILHAFQRLV